MAIRYFCDHCGQPALTCEPSIVHCGYGPVSVPTIAYKGTHIEIAIRKDIGKDTDVSEPGRREKLFGDICLDCLIDAVRHGERDNGNA